MRSRGISNGAPATMSGNAGFPSAHDPSPSRLQGRGSQPDAASDVTFCTRDDTRVRTLVSQLSGNNYTGLEGRFERCSRRELVARLALQALPVPRTMGIDGIRRMLMAHAVNGECFSGNGVSCRFALSVVRATTSVQNTIQAKVLLHLSQHGSRFVLQSTMEYTGLLGQPIEKLKILRRCVRDFARTRFKGKQTEFNLLQRRDTHADLGTVRRLRWPVVVLLIMCSPTSMACSGLSTCVPSFRSHMHLVSSIRIL